MASEMHIASKWFGVAVKPDRDHHDCLTAQGADIYHMKSVARIEAATALLEELHFSMDSSNHTHDMTRHYVEAVMGLLCMSTATALAVQHFIGAQVSKEWSGNQQAMAAKPTAAFAPGHAEHA